MNGNIVPNYGETAARFEVGARVWSHLYDMHMHVEARAYVAGVWVYCLVDPVDPDGPVYTTGLTEQLQQDRLSEWHRDAEVSEHEPVAASFNLFFAEEYIPGWDDTQPYDAGQGRAAFVTEKTGGKWASQADGQQASLGFFRQGHVLSLSNITWSSVLGCVSAIYGSLARLDGWPGRFACVPGRFFKRRGEEPGT